MKKALPSLNAIRFFECAARHLSFTRAGEELFVTQGAVSKQIKLLEGQLGLQLFHRKGPYLSLTREGQKLFATVATAVGIIESGIKSLQYPHDDPLTITLLPSFSIHWLMPRLSRFEARYPDISVRLASSYSNVDFNLKRDIDMGIRLGLGVWPGLHVTQVTRDKMFPVCKPELAARIKSVDDLAHQTLLVDNEPYDEWERWFAAQDKPYLAGKRKVFDDTSTQIRGSVEGQGISLVREELVYGYLETGILVRLFDIDYFSPMHYFAVCLESRRDEPAIARFRQWLLDEVATSRS
ncbi:MAG: transcriptional regulator GcvA, partial [Gammaproteobacteria bacterium]